MIRTQIQLEEDQYQSLRELAAVRHVSMAELIRQAIGDMLATRGTVSGEERRRRALAVVGQFRSGQTDISEQHDKYLAEAYAKWSSS